ncbi:hypothetical protein D1007_53342 [Hordeum vulgare]|nr:hypothetical protein D1007_53342 [Hordeum vulgare]
MAGDGSRSDGSNVDMEEVALRIALRRSLQDQGSPGDNGSASSGIVARPSREARNFGCFHSGRSAPGQVRLPPPPPSAPEAVPDHRWVLVPALGTGRARAHESEARATRRERQQARERGEALAVRCSTSSTSVDPKDALLAGVLRCLPTTAKMDARCLRHKSAKALRLAIQFTERETTEEAAKAARHVKEQEPVLRGLSGMRCSSDEDDIDVSTTSDSDDDDASPHVDAYTEEGHSGVDDRKGKGRRGNGDFLRPSPFCSYFNYA